MTRISFPLGAGKNPKKGKQFVQRCIVRLVVVAEVLLLALLSLAEGF